MNASLRGKCLQFPGKRCPRTVRCSSKSQAIVNLLRRANLLRRSIFSTAGSFGFGVAQRFGGEGGGVVVFLWSWKGGSSYSHGTGGDEGGGAWYSRGGSSAHGTTTTPTPCVSRPPPSRGTTTTPTPCVSRPPSSPLIFVRDFFFFMCHTVCLPSFSKDLGGAAKRKNPFVFLWGGGEFSLLLAKKQGLEGQGGGGDQTI